MHAAVDAAAVDPSSIGGGGGMVATNARRRRRDDEAAAPQHQRRDPAVHPKAVVPRVVNHELVDSDSVEEDSLTGEDGGSRTEAIIPHVDSIVEEDDLTAMSVDDGAQPEAAAAGPPTTAEKSSAAASSAVGASAAKKPKAKPANDDAVKASSPARPHHRQATLKRTEGNEAPFCDPWSRNVKINITAMDHLRYNLVKSVPTAKLTTTLDVLTNPITTIEQVEAFLKAAVREDELFEGFMREWLRTAYDVVLGKNKICPQNPIFSKGSGAARKGSLEVKSRRGKFLKMAAVLEKAGAVAAKGQVQCTNGVGWDRFSCGFAGSNQTAIDFCAAQGDPKPSCCNEMSPKMISDTPGPKVNQLPIVVADGSESSDRKQFYIASSDDELVAEGAADDDKDDDGDDDGAKAKKKKDKKKKTKSKKERQKPRMSPHRMPKSRANAKSLHFPAAAAAVDSKGDRLSVKSTNTSVRAVAGAAGSSASTPSLAAGVVAQPADAIDPRLVLGITFGLLLLAIAAAVIGFFVYIRSRQAAIVAAKAPLPPSPPAPAAGSLGGGVGGASGDRGKVASRRRRRRGGCERPGACLPDEMTLRAGDTVEVIATYDDGWGRGKNLTTGAVGVFPLQVFVE
ncbi:hypothetical protein DFJ73DRAFT_792336 [Zopfochytrium polystomum]|nr:hypothetical protein DFJ73DRAFT_792336 [Zopfochytrium polystomum]